MFAEPQLIFHLLMLLVLVNATSDATSSDATGSTSNVLEQNITYTLKEFLTEYEKRGKESAKEYEKWGKEAAKEYEKRGEEAAKKMEENLTVSISL